MKCDQYWPSRGTETYGLIQVTLLDTVELATYCVRTFALYKVPVYYVYIGLEGLKVQGKMLYRNTTFLRISLNEMLTVSQACIVLHFKRKGRKSSHCYNWQDFLQAYNPIHWPESRKNQAPTLHRALCKLQRASCKEPDAGGGGWEEPNVFSALQ